jgi:transcriptional antiterminator RfaH
VQLDINRDNLVPLYSTKGVSGLVRFGEQLPTLPAGFIDGLLQVTDPASGLIPLPEPGFLPGDTVTIEEGPLAGLQGVFKALTGQERVIILLDLLGKQNTVILPRRSIARAA